MYGLLVIILIFVVRSPVADTSSTIAVNPFSVSTVNILPLETSLEIVSPPTGIDTS